MSDSQLIESAFHLTGGTSVKDLLNLTKAKAQEEFDSIRSAWRLLEMIRSGLTVKLKSLKPSTIVRLSRSVMVCSVPRFLVQKDYECLCGKYKRLSIVVYL